jgi:hypothetical protein
MFFKEQLLEASENKPFKVSGTNTGDRRNAVMEP